MFLIWMIVFSVAVSVGLAFFSAARTSKPVISVFNLLQENNPDFSSTNLPGEISRLIEKNESMQEVIRQQMEDQRTALFYSLLSGGFRDTTELCRSFSRFSVSLQGPRYCMLLVSMDDWEIDGPLPQISAYKRQIKEVLAQQMPRLIGICDLDLKRSLLLTSAPAGELSGFKARLEEEAGKLSRQFTLAIQSNILFTAAFAESLAQIPAVFFALQHAEFPLEQAGKIFWLPQTEKLGRQSFYFPLHVEIQLISAVQEGRTVLVGEILDLIARHNRKLFTDPENGHGRKLMQAMYGTLLRLMNESGEDREDLALGSGILFTEGEQHSPKEIFEILREDYLAATVSYSGTAGSRSEALKTKIREYVDSHFAESQLSLAAVASVFHVTEPYLSRLFKQAAGENFSKYVEKLRMEKAHQLIEEGELCLNEVAEAVGYNSIQVFRRAYKRVYQTPPSEQR